MGGLVAPSSLRPTLSVMAADDDRDPLAGVNAETVDALLRAVQRFEDAEERRGESLNARASGVSGFVGLIIAVSVTLANFQTAPVQGHARHAILALLLAAVVAFLVAMWMVIFTVLRPAPAFVIHEDEVAKYPTYPWIRKRPVEVQGYLVRAGAKVLRKERDRNKSKAAWLNRAYTALLIGVVCLSVGGLILFHANGRSERDIPRRHATAAGGAQRADRIPLRGAPVGSS